MRQGPRSWSRAAQSAPAPAAGRAQDAHGVFAGPSARAKSGYTNVVAATAAYPAFVLALARPRPLAIAAAMRSQPARILAVTRPPRFDFTAGGDEIKITAVLIAEPLRRASGEPGQYCRRPGVTAR